VERDLLHEKLSPQVPVYIVNEGSEPPFFTRFFAWDSGKSAVSVLKEHFDNLLLENATSDWF